MNDGSRDFTPKYCRIVLSNEVAKESIVLFLRQTKIPFSVLFTIQFCKMKNIDKSYLGLLFHYYSVTSN